MNRIDSKTRYAAFILLVALLAAAAVAAFRFRVEAGANRVELAMDYTDFAALARSYNYNAPQFLVALRRAGLTSLALTEELGANVGDAGLAYATTGAQLINQARISPISDPLLASLARANAIDRSAVYLIVNDRASYDRYRAQLALHFEPKTVKVLRDSKPWLIEVRTQIDYFNATALGIPADQLQLARRLHLLVVARLQNDERFQEPQMTGAIDDVLRSGAKVSNVVFFGLRNQVFGFPDHIDDAARVFAAHGAKSKEPFNFGTIETYDPTQVQKGSEMLGRLLPNQTVRLQAIARTEMDKITPDEFVGRYELGARERNVRIVYLRPWQHTIGDLSIEATNVKIVKDLATELRARGLRLGRATPLPPYRGDNRILVGIAALAAPSILVLLLGFVGAYRTSYAIAAYGLTVLIYAGGVVTHHDLLARSVIALVGALCFAAAAFLALQPAFVEEPAPRLSDQLIRSAGWTILASAIALCGALVVVGIMSSPLTMEEIERFRGVKAVLALPPIIALGIYLFVARFNGGAIRPRAVFTSPIALYQVIVGIAIVAAATLLLMRSGNQSDIAPSSFELALRHYLASVLSVRPRTKLFAVGAPALMLLPALLPSHRRAVGWLLALAIGVGIGDIIDTFSHLHTPLLVSLLRVANGVVVGVLIGALLVWVYRRAALAFGLLRVR